MANLEDKLFRAKDVTGKDFGSEVLKRKVSVVEFWAPWCRPCKQLGEMIDGVLPDIHSLYGTGINFLKVNVDEENLLAQRYGVFALPTVLGFAGPNPVDRFSGRTKGEFLKWVEGLAQRVGA